MGVKNLTKNQKRVLELMYRVDQPWFGAAMFTSLCGYARPSLTMGSLHRRELVYEMTIVQMDLEGADGLEIPSGLFCLSKAGVAWAYRRFKWFDARGFSMDEKNAWVQS